MFTRWSLRFVAGLLFVLLRLLPVMAQDGMPPLAG